MSIAEDESIAQEDVDLLVFKTERKLDHRERRHNQRDCASIGKESAPSHEPHRKGLPVRLDSRSLSEGIINENGGEHVAPTGAAASVESLPGATSATRTPAALDLDLNEASDLHSSTTIPVVVAVSEMSKINHGINKEDAEFELVPEVIDLFSASGPATSTLDVVAIDRAFDKLPLPVPVDVLAGAIKSERLGSRIGASPGEGLAFINLDLKSFDSCSYAETGAVDKSESTLAVADEKVSYIACLFF